MITDEQVIELYKAAGWTAQHFDTIGGEKLWYIANPKGVEADSFSDHYMDSPEAAWQDANLPDPRHSLDAAFRLLDAIASHVNVAFFYGMDGLMCKIHTTTSAVLGVDPYRPDYTPSRALAMTAALLLMVSEKGAQS